MVCRKEQNTKGTRKREDNSNENKCAYKVFGQRQVFNIKLEK